MSYPDIGAAVTALAARFEPATIGTPTGAPAMREVYDLPPKGVPTVPAVVLEVQDGTIVAQSSYWEHHVSVDTVFLLSQRPGDPARVEANRRRWLPYLWSATIGQWKLGIGGQSGYELKSALPVSWEFIIYAVGSNEFDAIRVTWDLWINQTVSSVP